MTPRPMRALGCVCAYSWTRRWTSGRCYGLPTTSPVGLSAFRSSAKRTQKKLRKYQRAIEAWEVTHWPVIQAWAQVGPSWDETGTRNLFSQVAPQFHAFAELFGQRLAAVLKQVDRDTDHE